MGPSGMPAYLSVVATRGEVAWREDRDVRRGILGGRVQVDHDKVEVRLALLQPPGGHRGAKEDVCQGRDAALGQWSGGRGRQPSKR